MQQIMNSMNSELVYPNETFIAAWTELKPASAATLSEQLNFNVKPVRAVSNSATSIRHHGEYMKGTQGVQADV